MDKEGGGMGSAVVLLILVVGVMMGIGMGYDKFRGPINSVVMTVNQAGLSLVTWLPFEETQKAASIKEKMAVAPPSSFTFQQILAQTRYVGTFLRWPVALILLGCTILVWRMGSIQNYINRYSMESLVQNNAQTFPCLIPVAWRSLLDEPLDKGPWRTSRQPIQFAAEHKLLIRDGKPIDKKLLIAKTGLSNLRSKLLKPNGTKGIVVDRKRATALFSKQLGAPYSDWSVLPDYQRGLAAALMAFGHGDKHEAQELLDQMSSSFVEPGRDKKNPSKEDPEQEFEIDIDGADELLEKYQDSEDLAHFTENHCSYVTVWFHALFEFAHQKGVLPSSQFVWLRPTDRTLWYTLNQVGGRTAWVEAAGPWAHYLAEEVIDNTLSDPEVKEALNGFERELFKAGWLPEEDQV